MDIGRRNNADPKWLLPLLCRRGKVTRDDIGAIRIFDRETKFEILEAAAGRFAASAEGTDDDITITPADGAPSGGEDRGRKGPPKSFNGRGSRPPVGPSSRRDGPPARGPNGKAPGKPRKPRPPRD